MPNTLDFTALSQHIYLGKDEISLLLKEEGYEPLVRLSADNGFLVLGIDRITLLRNVSDFPHKRVKALVSHVARTIIITNDDY